MVTSPSPDQDQSSTTHRPLPLSEIQESQVEYWRNQLAGAPAVLELPTDWPREAGHSRLGKTQTHVIPGILVDKLKTLSQAEGVTLFITLLAAFQLLLSRYSGQDDVVVGSPVAGRNCPDIEPLIDGGVTMLPLRTSLSGDPTFRELLARVKKIVLDGSAHQEIPFDDLVEELKRERSPSYNSIFQVTFGLQYMPRQSLRALALGVEQTLVHQETTNFDMAWFAWETYEGLSLRVCREIQESATPSPSLITLRGGSNSGS